MCGRRLQRPLGVLPHLDNDLALGSTLLEIRKRLLGLLERKDLVDHRPDAPRLEKLADLCELAAVWVHEQERIRDAALLGAANDLAAQKPNTATMKKFMPRARANAASGGPMRETTVLFGLRIRSDFQAHRP